MSTAPAAVTGLHRPRTRIRVVTAASLFDGHDAAINIMRRLLQSQGAEVIHLGHDRSVEEIVEAAVQEDVHAVAVSSYQGGHIDYFRYLVDCLARAGVAQVRVYGGGGGTITAEEAEALQTYGVARIFLPEDGRSLGLAGMIRLLLEECAASTLQVLTDEVARLSPRDPAAVARLVTWFEASEDGADTEAMRDELEGRRSRSPAPVLGFTGTGGSGKSSVLDEVVRRFRIDAPDRTIGLLLVDPTRRRSGGALLGDRIRMNSIHGPGIFVRSLATRQVHRALSRTVADFSGDQNLGGGNSPRFHWVRAAGAGRHQLPDRDGPFGLLLRRPLPFAAGDSELRRLYAPDHGVGPEGDDRQPGASGRLRRARRDRISGL